MIVLGYVTLVSRGFLYLFAILIKPFNRLIKVFIDKFMSEAYYRTINTNIVL